MATNLLPIHSLGITTSTIPARRSSDNHRRKTSTIVGAAAGNKWWSPIFGWSSDADYIDSDNNNSKEDPMRSETKPAAKAKAKFTPGSFTEEKARRLRMMTMETETFNEVMYHSAVASRLATDFPRRSAQ